MVMTMDAVDVHSVVIEKRSGPMFTSMPSLSENQRKKNTFRFKSPFHNTLYSQAVITGEARCSFG